MSTELTIEELESIDVLIQDTFNEVSYHYFNYNDDGDEVDYMDNKYNIKYFNSKNNYLNLKKVENYSSQEIEHMNYDMIEYNFLFPVIQKIINMLRKGFACGNYVTVSRSIPDNILVKLVAKKYKENLLSYLQSLKYERNKYVCMLVDKENRKIVGLFLSHYLVSKYIQDQGIIINKKYETRTMSLDNWL